MEVYEESLEFGSGTSVKEININSSGSISFSIMEENEWCKVEKSFESAGFYTLSVAVEENNSNQKRECVIMLHSGDMSRQVTVVQYGRESTLELSLSEIDFNGNAGEREVEVLSNEKWQVDIPVEWITVKTGITDGYNGYFTVYTKRNDSTSIRSALLTVKYGNNKEKSIVINQSAKSELISVSADTVQVMPVLSSRLIEVGSCYEWKATTDATWCKICEITENSFVLLVDKNEGYENREAKIIVSNSMNECEIIVVQKKGKISLAEMWHKENVGELPFGDYFQFNEEVDCPEGYVIPSKKDYEHLIQYVKLYDKSTENNPGNVVGLWFGVSEDAVNAANSEDYHGCIFFPAGGTIAMSGINRQNENGNYWTRDYASEKSRIGFTFYSSGTTLIQNVFVNPDITNKRNVRCIKEQYSQD